MESNYNITNTQHNNKINKSFNVNREKEQNKQKKYYKNNNILNKENTTSKTEQKKKIDEDKGHNLNLYL